MHKHNTTVQAPGERIEVLTLEIVKIDDQEGRSGSSKGEQELKDLKQRGRSLLQSADASPSNAASDAAAAAAALNPGASMQGDISSEHPHAVSVAAVNPHNHTDAQSQHKPSLTCMYVC